MQTKVLCSKTYIYIPIRNYFNLKYLKPSSLGFYIHITSENLRSLIAKYTYKSTKIETTNLNFSPPENQVLLLSFYYLIKEDMSMSSQVSMWFESLLNVKKGSLIFYLMFMGMETQNISFYFATVM